MSCPAEINDNADPEPSFQQRIRVSVVVADSELQQNRVSVVAINLWMGRHAVGAGVAQPAGTGGVPPYLPKPGLHDTNPQQRHANTPRDPRRPNMSTGP
jgi:hypothetical protein